MRSDRLVLRGVFLLMLVFSLLLTSCGDTAPAAENGASSPALTEAQILGYTILRDDNAKETGVRNGMLLREAMEEAGYSMHLSTDFYREGIAGLEILPTEILVGKTNREETAAFLDSLAPWQWGYALIGTKIVIAGHSDETTTDAVNAFIERIVKRTPLSFSESDRYVYGDLVEGAGRVYSVLAAYEPEGAGFGEEDIVSAVWERSPEIVIRVKPLSEGTDARLKDMLPEGYAEGFRGAAGTTWTEICYLESAYTFSAGETARLLSYPNLSEEQKGALVYSVLRCRDTGDKMIFAAADLPLDSSSSGRTRSVTAFLKYAVSYPVALFGTDLSLGAKNETTQSDLFAAGYTPAMSIAGEKTGEDDATSALFFPFERTAVKFAEAIAPGLSYTEFQKAAK